MGLATAFLAHEQGRSVRLLDAEDRPVGASVQNFGHACFTGQADVIQPIADAARAGWLSAASRAGLWVGESGTYIPAMTPTEAQVLREFADHRGAERVTLLSGAQVGEAIGNPDLGAHSGAHLPLDLRVNPREAAPELARWLDREGVQFTWNTRVYAVVDGVAHTSRGDFCASEIIVCPGTQLGQLWPEIAERRGVRECALVMALIDRPDRIPADLVILTGTSLARYDGFTAMPSASRLQEELSQREPELVDCRANLMATGLPNGLLVGDSHAYDRSTAPFIDERTGDLLLQRASRFLGIDRPVVRQRWLGRYADSASTNLVVERPDSRTTVAAVTSGIGMTLSFGIADALLSGADIPDF